MSAADNRGDAIADELRRSGEELARLAEGLGTTPREIEAFFSAAARHMAVLTEASLIDQAFATGVMALLTAFGHRFSPRDCAAPYLSMLLRVAVAGALAQQQAALSSDSFAMGHFEAIDAELGPLALASYRELEGDKVLPPQLAEPYSQLAAWVDADVLFQGQTIRASLAMDILYDIAARLKAVMNTEF